MKILYVVDNFAGGGKERRLLELVKGLEQANGFELSLVILGSDIFYKEILQTDCEVHVLNRNFGRGWEFDIFKKIQRIYREFNPDIVHFWGEVGMVYLLPLTIFGKKPIVNSIIANTSPRGGLGKRLLRKLSFRFSNLILSNTVLGLNSYKPPTQRSKVIYNGFEFSRLKNLKEESQVRTEYNISSKFVIMMVGSYSERKDYRTFLTSTENLIKEGIDLTVITAGGGDQNYLTQFIDDSNADYYRFLGFQQDIESVMNIVTVGVLCSNSKLHSEGISNALLEFMALGKPVVATRDGGNVELIVDDESGFLVNPQDHNDLTAKLKLLFQSKDRCQTMGNTGKQIVLDKFSLEQMVDGFIKEYRDLVEG